MKPPASPAPSAPLFLEWMPVFLATLSINGLDRALHVAKVDLRTVEAARVAYASFESACQMLAEEHARREAQRKAAAPAPASAADLSHVAGNHHAVAAIVRADLDTLVLFCTRIAAAAGLDEIDGHRPATWFLDERRAMLERNLLAIGDTDPELYEHLQRHLGACRGHADPNSMLRPPEA